MKPLRSVRQPMMYLPGDLPGRAGGTKVPPEPDQPVLVRRIVQHVGQQVGSAGGSWRVGSLVSSWCMSRLVSQLA